MNISALPYPAVTRLLAIVSLTAIVTGVAVNWRFPYLMDFLSYWAAGVIAVGGTPADAYNVALHHAVQARALPFDTRLPFAYPPPYLLLLIPFGIMPYAMSAAAWIAVTLTGYVIAVRRLMPEFTAAAIAFPPVAVCGISGQNGYLTAALFIGGLSTMSARPFVAGLLFGCIAIKPQLGLLLPLAFIAGREWRMFAGATVSVILMTIFSLLAFGFAPWQGFFGQSALFASIASDGLVGWNKMASVYAALRLAGMANTPALLLHIAFAAAGAVMVWRMWSGSKDILLRGAILAPASLLISPYLYVYDQISLVVSLYWLTQQSVSRPLIIALFLLPIATIAQYWAGGLSINPAPLLQIIILLIIWRKATPVMRRSEPRQAALGAA